MPVQDQLHLVISGMSRAEKRHFKLFAHNYQGKSSNHQIKLFDAYAKLKQFDSKDLLQAVGHETFAPYLSALKYQLFNLVLDSLANLHCADSIPDSLNRQLAHIKILHNRGAFHQCKKVLKRTRAKAEMYEQHTIILELQAWDRRLLHDTQGMTSEDAITQSFEQTRGTLRNIEEHAQFEQLMSTAQLLRRRHARTREQARQQELLQLLYNPLLANTYQTRTKRNRLHQLEVRASLRLMLGEYRAARAELSSALSVWTQYPAMQQLLTAEYKKTLDQFLNCCIAGQEFNNFDEAIERLKDLNSKEADGLPYRIGSIQFIELTRALNCGLLQEAINICNDIRSHLPHLTGKLRTSRVTTLLHNCAVTYFINSNYGKTAEVLHDILTGAELKAKRDIVEFAQILQLIVQYELGNIDVLEALCRTTPRRLKTQSTFLEFERGLVAMLRKLLNAADKTEQISAIRDFYSTCVALANNAQRQATPVGLSEMLLWLNSKLTRRSIVDVYRHGVHCGGGVFSIEHILNESAV